MNYEKKKRIFFIHFVVELVNTVDIEVELYLKKGKYTSEIG